METDEEVALTTAGPCLEKEIPRVSMAGAGALRRELSHRAEHYARSHMLPHCLSYGGTPTVCFERYANHSQHGNFLPSAYAAILKNQAWRGRLEKVHTQGHKSLPRRDHGRWRELDACTSSDALLMNVFCTPRAFGAGGVCSLFDVAPQSIPEFGFRARVPLINGKFDRTEVDMRLGNLLVEAKLTEGDFQRAPKAVVNGYRDFSDSFRCEDLPQTTDDYFSYQLIRNILAAHSSNGFFCLLTDARRPDLIEAWYAVLRCVTPVELRLRCRIMTWQELAIRLGKTLRGFLAEKYGIEPG